MQSEFAERVASLEMIQPFNKLLKVCIYFAQHDGLVIPGVTAEPKLRHSVRSMTPLPLRPFPSFQKYPQNPNFVIPRAVAESIFACQRSSRRSQRPWRSTMDTATSRSMTVLVGQRRLCSLASFACHSRSKRRTQTSSFRAQHDALAIAPLPVIPEVPTEPKPRHSARSRGIHLCLPTQ